MDDGYGQGSRRASLAEMGRFEPLMELDRLVWSGERVVFYLMPYTQVCSL